MKIHFEAYFEKITGEENNGENEKNYISFIDCGNASFGVRHISYSAGNGQ